MPTVFTDVPRISDERKKGPVGLQGYSQTLCFKKLKSGFNTVRLSCGKTRICSDLPRGAHDAAYSLVFEAQSLTNRVKALGIIWKLPRGGPSGNTTFPVSCATSKSLISLKTSLGQKISDNPCNFSTVCPKLKHWNHFCQSDIQGTAVNMWANWCDTRHSISASDFHTELS